MKADHPFLRCFSYDHLQDPFRWLAKEYYQLAQLIIQRVPPSLHRSIALVRLLEAREATLEARKLSDETDITSFL